MNIDTRPTLTAEALSLHAFAEGAEKLAQMLEDGEALHGIPEQQRTPEQRETLIRAEQAAHALRRNAPGAIRCITRLQNAAEDTVGQMHRRRDDILNDMFGKEVTPDAEASDAENS